MQRPVHLDLTNMNAENIVKPVPVRIQPQALSRTAACASAADESGRKGCGKL